MTGRMLSSNDEPRGAVIFGESTVITGVVVVDVMVAVNGECRRANDLPSGGVRAADRSQNGLGSA